MPSTIIIKEHWRRRPRKKTLGEKAAESQARRRPRRRKRVGLR